MSNHCLNMTTARRRNNIYGEISDHTIMPFIAMGGDGAIYNTEELEPSSQSTNQLIASNHITFYGRSATAMYVVKVLLRHGPYDSTPALTPAMIESLKSAALFLSATPLYAVSHVYSQTTKYYTLSGAKVTLIR